MTFDDGPIPGPTEFVLDELAKFNAKATFFCVGENIKNHPEIFKRLHQEGHRVGNHTYNHLNGRKTSFKKYLENVSKCQQLIPSEIAGDTKLFRPPYGLFTKNQKEALRKKYDVVMWEVLSADFSPTISPEKCLKKSIKHCREGSIIVFHDSLKTIDKLKYVLPRFLAHFTDKGYTFETI